MCVSLTLTHQLLNGSLFFSRSYTIQVGERNFSSNSRGLPTTEATFKLNDFFHFKSKRNV
ncbi:hypothetical protein RchiOBHm_Chr1g0351441 [Rosa chinensis]|uniref:Uncharacterized protein n=1 Tax=Rosa chinensis TaxID=74649 RepID=A0A2P6SGB2_ROSCH|nr:hypothetical protein RchiOBHm_Chr1g0351441 [Rosa chinensis]